MKSDGEKGGQVQAWYRGKIGFIVSATPITVAISSIITGASLLRQKTPTESITHNSLGAVNFTCSLYFHNETFTVAVEVNLKDGMNQDEAIKVANKVFEVTLGQGGQPHQFRSANVDEKGIWTIELTWGYSIHDLGHWFEAVINPFNQTVIYNHCK